MVTVRWVGLVLTVALTSAIGRGPDLQAGGSRPGGWRSSASAGTLRERPPLPSLSVARPAPLRSAPATSGWRPAWRAAAPLRAAHGFRLPAEFERQRALLLSCHEFVDDMPDVLAEIIRHLQGRVEVIALVNDVVEYQRARDRLVQFGCPLDAVRFAEVPHDTMWCRDYGPILVEDARGLVTAIDTEYVRGVRPQDDDVPFHLCRQLRLPLRLTPLRIEGGNLLSNGQGLCLTTRQVLDNNAAQLDEKRIRRELRECFGASQVVFLEPLAGEPTGHVDMFATFTSPTTVVVGHYDPQQDPVNSELLDRNARQLARVHTAEGRLDVIRVPMPPRDETVWRTYTNVVYANGVVLVPVYREADESDQDLALKLYRNLLPGWRIVPIDASRIAELGGAVHCITLNLGPLKSIPPFPRPQRMLDDRQSIAAR